jgi:RNA 2',3'-cyclic 3'-phosphodiesterase
MIRAFLGIAVPPEIRGALQVQQYLLPLPRRVDPETLHLTLVYLGACREPVLEAAHEGFAALKERGFPLSLQGFGLFGKDRPHGAWAAVVPSENLSRLQARTAGIALRAGCPVDTRTFLPHVTLGRFAVPGLADRLRLERAVATTVFRAGPWQVDAMTLWQSHAGRKGHWYSELARYPFAAG